MASSRIPCRSPVGIGAPGTIALHRVHVTLNSGNETVCNTVAIIRPAEREGGRFFR